jgi:GNAT superfamily N-acetyltransferase
VRHGAQVAQLVEHVTENHGVGGSIPPLGTTIASLLLAGGAFPFTHSSYEIEGRYAAPADCPASIMTSDRPIVRSMRPRDAAEIIQMARELAAVVCDPEPMLAESDLVRDGSGAARWFDCLVAELAGGLVGFALLGRAFEAHTAKRRLWLGDLYVRPAARGRGTGRALMTAVARHAVQLGCDGVYWELWRMNFAGAAFYRELRAEEVADLAIMRIDKERLAAMAADADQ